MKTTLFALAATAATAGTLFAGIAVAQTDPAVAARSDMSKLLAEANATHDTVIADAGKLESDAHSLVGATKQQIRVTLRADRAALRTDMRAGRVLLHADRAQLLVDLKAARQAKVAKQLKPELQQLHAALKQDRAEVKQALASAREAVKALRAGLKK